MSHRKFHFDIKTIICNTTTTYVSRKKNMKIANKEINLKVSAVWMQSMNLVFPSNFDYFFFLSFIVSFLQTDRTSSNSQHNQDKKKAFCQHHVKCRFIGVYSVYNI